MDTNAIKAFIAVAESMSVTKASRSLYLTQPAVSRRIAQLEEQLGVSLFDRANKKMFLTASGHKLLPRCKAILADMEAAVREASNMGDRVMGHLTIGMSHHVSVYRAPAYLKRYQDLYPDVDLDLSFLTSEEAISLVQRGKLELAMATLPQKAPPSLEFTPMWEDELLIAIPNKEEYRDASLEELVKKPVILPHPPTTTRKNIESVFRKLDLSFTHVIETSNFEVIHKMTETGLGWGILPSHMINAEDIVPAFTDTFKAIRTQGIVRHHQRQLSLPSQALLDLLLNQSDSPHNKAVNDV